MFEPFFFVFFLFLSSFIFNFFSFFHFLSLLFFSLISPFFPVVGGGHLPNSIDVTNATFPVVVSRKRRKSRFASSHLINNSNNVTAVVAASTHRSNGATNNTKQSCRSKTRWGPRPSTTQTAATSFPNGSLDQLQLGARAVPQHSGHVIIIDDDDSTPKTQRRHIVDSDDETNASSSITNSERDDSEQSNVLTLDSTSPHSTHSGSHFRLTGDESIGFDTFRHAYGSVSSNSISALDRQYGKNDILWNKPVIINNHNIDDDVWKPFYHVIHSNIFLVIEGPPKPGCAQVGTNERPLDHDQWKACHTPFLICIAPPDRGSCQSYLLFDARECHYEVFGNRLIESIRGTNLSILLFPAGGTNTRSAHCYVINEQKYLNGFPSMFEQMAALSLLKKYQDIRISTKSNKRHVAAPADFGICSKFF